MPYDGALSKRSGWERSLPYGGNSEAPLLAGIVGYLNQSSILSLSFVSSPLYPALPFSLPVVPSRDSHNVCLDRFGAPWPGEDKPLHGEVCRQPPRQDSRLCRNHSLKYDVFTTTGWCCAMEPSSHHCQHSHQQQPAGHYNNIAAGSPQHTSFVHDCG
jgi:hypothetical protein